jgi:hypothetical protein
VRNDASFIVQQIEGMKIVASVIVSGTAFPDEVCVWKSLLLTQAIIL